MRIDLLSVFKMTHAGISSCDEKMEYVSACNSAK